jgi:hypothetical protein
MTRFKVILAIMNLACNAKEPALEFEETGIEVSVV